MFYYEQLKDESIRKKIVAKASEDTYFYSIICRFTDTTGEITRGNSQEMRKEETENSRNFTVYLFLAIKTLT